MKILFDHNTPAPLARILRHEVSLARDFGWQMLTNGELLDAAEKAGFDLVLTCDQNYAYQQSFGKRKIAVVILSSNRWPQIEPLTARIRQAVDFAQKGQITHIDLAEL